jgi:hypothetical protein
VVKTFPEGDTILLTATKWKNFAERGIFFTPPSAKHAIIAVPRQKVVRFLSHYAVEQHFFPLPGQPGTNAAREWAQVSASVRFRQLRRNPISFKLNMPRCGIAGREIENRKVLQGVVHLMRCSSFFLGSCQKMLICDKLGRKCEV